MSCVRTFLIAIGLLLIALGVGCWLGGLDPALAAPFRLQKGEAAVRVAVALSLVGGFSVLGPAAILAALAFGLTGMRQPAMWLVATIASGRLLVEGLKLALHRARPDLIDRLAPVTSWSFPSSHSAGAMLTCVAIALAIGRRRTLLPALLAGLAIGWSRLALGVHWPGDVLAGWGIALVWAGGAARWLAPRAHSGNRIRS